LYLEGAQVYSTTDIAARASDCQVLMEDGPRSFTMTAFDSSGNESAHSNAVEVIVSSTVLAGDVNASGAVDLEDLYLVQKILAGRTPGQTIHVGADVNGDGQIGAVEAQYIMQIISGLR
jgi:hypothetical protein